MDKKLQNLKEILSALVAEEEKEAAEPQQDYFKGLHQGKAAAYRHVLDLVQDIENEREEFK